jgi:hypothetical protein
MIGVDFGHYEAIVHDRWDGAIRIDREKSRRKLLQPSNVDVIVSKRNLLLVQTKQ